MLDSHDQIMAKVGGRGGQESRFDLFVGPKLKPRGSAAESDSGCVRCTPARLSD